MPRRTVYTLLKDAAAELGDTPALHQPVQRSGTRTYQTYSWNQFKEIVEAAACGLRTLGLQKGDVVAIAADTSADFYLADMSVMAAGCIAAAVYLSYPPEDQVRTIRECDAKLVIADSLPTMRKLTKAAGDEPLAGQWIVLEGENEGSEDTVPVLTFADLRARGVEAMEQDPQFFACIEEEVQPEDYAILYLTSGATGQPKMALVTHHACVSNTDIGPEIGLDSTQRTLVFLPAAHITQRLAGQLLPIRCGMKVYFTESLMRLPQDLRTVKPHFFVAPPRLWERIYTSICTEVKKKGGAAEKLFYWALGVGLTALDHRMAGKPIPRHIRFAQKIADRLVYQKVRDRFGGEMRLAASGSAPLGRDLARFYLAINFPLVEGFGLTEGGITALNPLDSPKPGTIGKVLPGAEMKVAEDGELLIRGPMIFSGYYKDPEATALVLNDGWVHTGDIASVDEDGYFSITGRKKEVIVNSNGKKVYPSRVESFFKMETLINHVVLVGDKLPYITALFTINQAIAEALPGMDSYKGKEYREIAVAPAVHAEVQRAVNRLNKDLAPFEQIRRFVILDEDFSVEGGELTATMKLRRARIIEKYKDKVDKLYEGKEEVRL
jgi:long-chain acyl-CoA synthetase